MSWCASSGIFKPQPLLHIPPPRKEAVLIKSTATRRNYKHPPSGRPRLTVDIEKMLKLYLHEKMSVREVAKIVGVSHATVARRITEKTGQLRNWRMPGEL